MRWVIGSGLRLAVSMYGKYGESGCSARGKVWGRTRGGAWGPGFVTKDGFGKSLRSEDGLFQ